MTEVIAGTTVAMTAITTTEKKLIKHVTDELNKVDNKAVKRTSDLGSEVASEINKMKRVITDSNDRGMERQRGTTYTSSSSSSSSGRK